MNKLMYIVSLRSAATSLRETARKAYFSTEMAYLGRHLTAILANINEETHSPDY
jgi:hypothetical protein